MPALSGARRLAKNTGCLTNLKSQYHGFVFFAEEHEQAVPTCFQFPMPEGLGRYIYQPYHELMRNAPDNGFRGFGGQGTAYINPALGVTEAAPQFMCPSVARAAGDNNDPLGVVENSAYIHYGMGMWMTFYWFNAPAGGSVDIYGGRRVDLRKFPDLRPFMGTYDPDADPSEFTHSRNFFAGGAMNGISPSKFCLVSEPNAYWFLNGARPGGGVRYRHNDRANTLLLDGSVRPAWLISNYGFEVLKW
jgi:prepilin-type processing-associated H-X9-DG protein